MKHWKSLNQTKPAAKCRCVTQAKVPMLVFYHFSTSIPCLKPVPSFKNKIKNKKIKKNKGYDTSELPKATYSQVCI